MTNLFIKLFSLFTFVLILTGCDNPNNPDFYDKYFNDIDFSGQVLIARKGETIYQKSFGYADMKTQRASQPNDTYLIGSVTKQFTGFCILLLEEKGRLSVTDPINKYYPDVPESWRSVTIHDLLTHSSGLPTFDDLENFSIQIPYKASDLLADSSLREFPLFDPGKFRYSSIGYVLLGGIVEIAGGMDFCRFVRENILIPFNLTASGCITDTVSRPVTTLGYEKNENGSYTNLPYTYMTCAQGNSNFYSNLNNLLLWDGAIWSKKVLSEKGLKKWFTGHNEVLETSEYEEKGDLLGYGWFLTFEGDELIKAYHLGGVTGYKASITRFPREELVVITLSNVEDRYSNKIRLEFPKLVYKMEVTYGKD